MNRALWLTLSCSMILAASGAAIAQQPDQLPPPPGAGMAQQALKSPVQSPVQAPGVAEYAPKTITCTVMVPQVTYKTITVQETVCRPEARQKTVAVSRLVPETQMVNCTTTIIVPEQRTTTKTYMTCRMTYENVSRVITVPVPYTETRQGTRTICKSVPVQETVTVCRDVGQLQTQSYVDCCGCTHSCQVWVPKMVTEQLPVTVYKPHVYQEPYEYQVVVCRPEQRTVTEQVAKPVYETQSREVAYYVPVAKQIEKQVPRTTFKTVTEEKVVNYTVMVPHQVERQVQVPVCTMVPKQVTYTVPTCGPCGSCGW